MKGNKITIIGSGNVANHLAHVFHKNNVIIDEICSRNKFEGLKLAKKVNTSYISDIQKTGKNSDIVVMAISDDSIIEVSKKLQLKNQIIIHTSGILDTYKLKEASINYGCLYPLQTFTKGSIVNFKKIPIILTASNEFTLQKIKKLASKISDYVFVMNDLQRQKYHLAAVVVNNFTNHLFTLTSNFLNNNSLEFDLLNPLIQETVKKVSLNDPLEIQTGPAKRGDRKTLKKHIEMLEGEDLKDIYDLITKSIYKTHNE